MCQLLTTYQQEISPSGCPHVRDGGTGRLLPQDHPRSPEAVQLSRPSDTQKLSVPAYPSPAGTRLHLATIRREKMGIEALMFPILRCIALSRRLAPLGGMGYFPAPESAGGATSVFAAAGPERQRSLAPRCRKDTV